MIQSIIIAFLSCLVVGFLFYSYRRLVLLDHQQFDAWGNVLDQQKNLLSSIANVMQIAGKLFDEQKRTDLIAATKHLLEFDDIQIAAIADAQQSLVLDLMACLATVDNRQSDIEDVDQWVACQDEIMSKVDDLYLAQQHYNTVTKDYNRWRDQLWVFWMADSLHYRKQPLVNIETHQASYDDDLAFSQYAENTAENQ
jgi:hypothetical protein